MKATRFSMLGYKNEVGQNIPPKLNYWQIRIDSRRNGDIQNNYYNYFNTLP